MSAKVRIKTFVICLASISMLIFWAAAGSNASNFKTSKQQIWIGTITVEETGYAFLDKDDSRENLTKTRYLNHSLHDKLTLLVRGQGEDLDILEAKRTYTENYKEKKILEHDHQLCDDGQIVKPGNSNRYDKSITKTIYRGAIGRGTVLREQMNPYPRVSHSVKLIGISDSQCLINVSSTALVDSELKEKSEIRWACGGETQTSEIHSETCAPDEDARSNLIGQGTTQTQLYSYNPPGEKVLGGVLRGAIKNDTLKGTQVIYEQQPTSLEGMAVKCVAEWDLRRVEKKSPCMSYIRNVLGDVKINGIDVEEGAFPEDLSGARISIGPDSRMQIYVGDTILYLKENTDITLVDPCGQKGADTEFDAKLMKGKIYALISRLTGKGAVLDITVTTVADARGVPLPLLGKKSSEVVEHTFSGPSGFFLNRAFQEREQPKTQDLDQDIIESAALVFMIENTPEKPLSIQAIKGEVEVKDSTGEMSVLKTGDVFKKKWKRAKRPSEIEEVRVRAKYSPPDKTP